MMWAAIAVAFIIALFAFAAISAIVETVADIIKSVCDFFRYL